MITHATTTTATHSAPAASRVVILSSSLSKKPNIGESAARNIMMIVTR